jgi:hypothetical protein
LDDIPLVRWHSTECPTCEQILMPIAPSRHELTEMAASVNSVTRSSLESESRDWVSALAPVLKLLGSGFYLLTPDHYYPTDGEGRLFWTAGYESHDCRALRSHWDTADTPTFLIGTQPAGCFSTVRFQSARTSYETRPGIALHLFGRLSALLDGHHRALAAAATRDTFLCVTISGVGISGRSTRLESQVDPVLRVHVANLPTPGSEWIAATLGSRSIQPSSQQVNDMVRTHSPEPRAASIPVSLPHLHDDYPTDEALDSVFRVSGRRRQIRDETIEGLLASRFDDLDSRDRLHGLILALEVLHDQRLIPTAMRIARDSEYRAVWRTTYKLLARHRSTEVDDLFVEFLINDDGTYPDIKQTIDDYFRQPPPSNATLSGEQPQ